MRTQSKAIIPSLTGFRAIAAWMIFVLHFFPFNNPVFPTWLKTFIKEWHIGVDMFFVLSGFLIAHRYFDQHPINFKKYMVNRFSRIYPMYFLITVGVFIDFIIRNQTWNTEKTIEAILSFTMTKSLFYKYRLSAGISQGWTLTLEELFYLSAPLFFLLIRKRKIWLYALPILILFLGIFLKKITQTPQNTWGFMQDNIAIYIFEFFTGIALALCIKKHQNLKPKFNFATYFGGVFILFYLTFNPFPFRSPDLIKSAQALVLSVFGIAPLLWGLMHEKTWLSWLLSRDFMVLLGRSSYVFYLIHKGFIPIFIYDYIAANVLTIFVILNILSVILFKFIEEPLNLWIRKKYGT